MDPRGQSQGMARYASHTLQFKPGRDVALLNAMLNVIIAEGMVDIQYVQAHTEGFDSLKAKVAAFTPEKMEPCAAFLPPPFATWPGSMPAPSGRSFSGAWASASIRTAPTMPAA